MPAPRKKPPKTAYEQLVVRDLGKMHGGHDHRQRCDADGGADGKAPADQAIGEIHKGDIDQQQQQGQRKAGELGHHQGHTRGTAIDEVARKQEALKSEGRAEHTQADLAVSLTAFHAMIRISRHPCATNEEPTAARVRRRGSSVAQRSGSPDRG
jgi:hypothetical protein